MIPASFWDSLIPVFLQPAAPCRGFACQWTAALADASGAVYTLAVVVLSLYGLNALLLTALFLWHWRKRRPAEAGPAPAAEDWPAVTVQLPVYNEMFVVERLIDAACALDYPAGRLSIQVLDDSTDGTTALACARAAYHAARGAAISVITRPERSGYKAGALAAALPAAAGDFIAIFDADFVPPPDFLRRVMPHFADPALGAVQARWGHLNAEYSPVTRAQALLLDGHFVVEQNARHASGCFVTFNGSAGVWRRACIVDAGGWQPDTLAEDLDLSYRAQLRGWGIRYLSDVVAPAEIPPQVMALKRQQYRWAKGSIQCLLKLAGALLQARAPLFKRAQGLIHLGAYFVHPAMLLLVLASLPLVLTGEVHHLPLGAAGVAGFGAPAMFGVAQWAAYRADWRSRFAYFFYIMLLGSGLALNNTWAVLEALLGRQSAFQRTPKFRVEGRQAGEGEIYALPIDWTTWGELSLALYAATAAVAALYRAPALAPFLCMYAASFAYIAFTAWRQTADRYRPARVVSRKSSVPPVMR